MCVPCHARRGQLSDGFVPGQSELWDFFEPVLLDDEAYYADGQVRDECFEWASFAQSAMSQHGVRCTHCHEPHTSKLRYDGNALCLQCHVTALNTSRHTFHVSAEGAACVGCHMPVTVFMGRHPRRDHGFTKPLPLL